MSKKRNLAFYKESGTNWTNEEFHKIVDYCGDETIDTITTNNFGLSCNCTYIYDLGIDNEFMFPWGDKDMTDKGPFTKISYESIFRPKQKLQKFTMKI